MPQNAATWARRGALLCLILGAGLLSWSVPTHAAETWKCYTYMPSPTHPVTVGLNKIAAAIQDISKGELTVNCSVGGSLPIKGDSIAQAVSDGVLNVVTSGFDSGYIPVAGLFSVPGLIATEDELDKAYQAALPYLEAEYAKRNIVVLASYHYPRQVIWSAIEMDSVDDLNGVKMRANSPENGEFIKRFGGIPITMATPDVAPALQRGVFPAVITAAAGAGQLWIEMLRYMVDVGPSYTVSLVLINQDSFGSLPADQQKAVREAAMAEGANISATMRTQNVELLEKFVKEGFKIAPGTPAEEARIVETMKPYWAEWAAARDEAATEALTAVRAALGK